FTPCGVLHGIRARLAALRDAEDTTPGWLDEAVAVDVALHQIIAANCGSPRLCHEINRYQELMVCVREAVGNNRDVQQIATDEHIAMVDHLAAGRADDAATAMRQHLEHTAGVAVALLFPGHVHALPNDGPIGDDPPLTRRRTAQFSGMFPRMGEAG
ncbi:MAG: FCD domain-containing protein, partial [Patescibacteria group bacterium]|nr:FCD domain-containing protein [Patescibacteria group bacterium]